MAYRLRDGVSFCQVDDCLVFLDLDTDRYFRLSARLEQALCALLEGDGAPEEDARDLVRRNVLTSIGNGETRHLRRMIEVPSRSVLENSTGNARPGVPVALEVFGVVSWTQLVLKTRPLDRVINRTITHRQRGTASRPSSAVAEPCPGHLVEATQQFMRSRLSVPIETCCLLDSLALVRFLARRGLAASLVFGVALDPFAAHCWVQAGTWVLNDTLGNVLAHTPIREV